MRGIVYDRPAIDHAFPFHGHPLMIHALAHAAHRTGWEPVCPALLALLNEELVLLAAIPEPLGIGIGLRQRFLMAGRVHSRLPPQDYGIGHRPTIAGNKSDFSVFNLAGAGLSPQLARTLKHVIEAVDIPF